MAYFKTLLKRFLSCINGNLDMLYFRHIISRQSLNSLRTVNPVITCLVAKLTCLQLDPKVDKLTIRRFFFIFGQKRAISLIARG